MEIATLAYALAIAFSLLAVDTTVYSGSVVIEVVGPPKTEKIEVDQGAVRAQFDRVISAVVGTRSLLRPPELVWSNVQGVGMAVAESVGLEKSAVALKAELGLVPDQLRVSFYWEDGALRSLVNAEGKDGVEFSEVLTRNAGETLMEFVSRSALAGAAELAPYYTAIYLLQAHSIDKDFRSLNDLIGRKVASTSAGPVNTDKSLYDNLLGLVALFENDPNAAAIEFANAMRDDTSNPVGFINASFVDLLHGDYQGAAHRMEELARIAPPANQVVLGSVYTTWAAALMGLHDLAGADRLLAAATTVSPHSGTAFGLWAELRGLAADDRAADAL